MPKTLSEWFCMKDGRASFKPSVIRDHELFCHETKIQDEVLISIERRFAAQQPVKMVLYGDWGVGKTHTLYFLTRWFADQQQDYPARTVLVELGDITAKSRFDVLVGPFLDKLGLRELVRLVHAYQPATGTHIIEALKNEGAAHNVAEAFGKFLLASPGDTPPSAVATAFDFLKGQRPRDAISIGLGAPLSQSDEFYSVMLGCGELVKKVENRRLIFVADEAAKLDDIESDEATLRHWVAANRLIFDDLNQTFGLIYTLSGRGQSQIPTVISDPQVMSRLGETNLIELPNLPIGEVQHFLSRLRESFLDKDRVQELVTSGEIQSADFDWARYPFTAPAWENFLDHWSRNQEDAKPRDICDKLDDVGFRALKAGRRLIDDECLQKARM